MQTKHKVPAKRKAELMQEIVPLLQDRYGVDVEGAVLYLLNYFTSVDLVEIHTELRREVDERGLR